MMLYKKSKTFAKTTLILREKPRTRSVLSTLAKDNFAKGKAAIGAAHLEPPNSLAVSQHQ